MDRSRRLESSEFIRVTDLDSKHYDYLLELQGECKIQQTRTLQFTILKTVFLLIPLIISVIGLFCLKYSKNLRIKVFYYDAPAQQATHIYIKGNGKKEQEIVPLIHKDAEIYFYYKELKYALVNHQTYPVALNYVDELKQKQNNSEFLKNGLSEAEAIKKRESYGTNEHIVKPPQYFQYLYEVMTEPFFFIQYMAAVIYFIEKLETLSFLLVGGSWITTTINYILLYISYRKFKEIAEKTIEIKVLRDGQMKTIASTQLVPGDLFIPNDEVCCDALLLYGEIYVNESNLTGESIPIGKYALTENILKWDPSDSSKWLYQGSKVLTKSNVILAMAINTGYTTKRGRIIRKILNRTPKTPHFFKTFVYFLTIVFIVATILYLATLYKRIVKGNLEPAVMVLNYLLYITFSYPPAFPIYFNLAYSCSLIRLKWKDILGTEPEKTVQAAHLAVMCFDKTGTLTETTMEVNKIFRFQSQKYVNITKQKNLLENQLSYKIFGSCHSVQKFNEQYLGDQIDLKMFLHSEFQQTEHSSFANSEIKFEVSKNASKIQVLKIFQYESCFQSMSVLVFDPIQNKLYVFVKGAPQMIHKYSTQKYMYFQKLLQDVSYGGFRTIAYGFKEIKLSQKDRYLNGTRQLYLSNTLCLGFVCFENKLKDDAKQTIQLLADAGIQSKMITGDNIYIAIETGIRAGFIDRKQEMIVIEGKDQLEECSFRQSQQIQKNMVLLIKKFKFAQDTVETQQFKITLEDYLKIEQPIIVDNEFLKRFQHIKLNDHIKIYARISPEYKALIVRRFKHMIKKQRDQKSKVDKMFSSEINKVGMVGDGANDLLAIKEADIGLGINNSDASYASSFSIQKLKDIDEIVRESKCTEQSIIQICRFGSISNFLTVPMVIIMETEGTFFSANQLMLTNITKSLIIPFLLCLSRPILKTSIYKPCSNFLKWQNQLVFWGNVIIFTLGYTATYIYYSQTSQYVVNTSKVTVDSGYNFDTHLETAFYIYFNLTLTILVFFVYEGHPWKEIFCKNVLLFIIFSLNLIFSICFYFLQQQMLDFFKIKEISFTVLLYLFLIAMVTTLVGLIYNTMISSIEFYKKQYDVKLKNVFDSHQIGSITTGPPTNQNIKAQDKIKT